MANPLVQLADYGQSPWLDYISRDLVRSGGLRKLWEEDGIKGVTSNPAIFEEAISKSDLYQADVERMAHEGMGAAEIYEALTVQDIQEAADVLRPLYDRLEGADGFVSLEVNPHLAHDTSGTVEEARRLWGRVGRPNVFIKVPATRAGLPAIRQLISEGINVNVTLLFGLERYRGVAEAYVAGLEDRAAKGQSVQGIASVASFFLSRIDVLLDPQLKAMAESNPAQAEVARGLVGEVAIACAKAAYDIYKEAFGGERFEALKAQGARPQRLLWASTGTKNPDYSDVKYVEPLVGADTVNTLPEKTIAAYRDHGQPANQLEQGMDRAYEVLAQAADLGFDLEKVSQQLEDEGVDKFNKPYDKLIAALEEARARALA